MPTIRDELSRLLSDLLSDLRDICVDDVRVSENPLVHTCDIRCRFLQSSEVEGAEGIPIEALTQINMLAMIDSSREEVMYGVAKSLANKVRETLETHAPRPRTSDSTFPPFDRTFTPRQLPTPTPIAKMGNAAFANAFRTSLHRVRSK